MNKIGIFGGSFDPVHLGHVRMAKLMASELSLDRVIVVPAARNPFKETSETEPEHRYNMCKLAFSDKLFTVSDAEIKRDGKSFTYDTVKEFVDMLPGSAFYLFIGSDLIFSFHRWFKAKEILNICKLCVFPRDEHFDPEEILFYCVNTLGLNANDLYISRSKPLKISSTEIREKLFVSTYVNNMLDKDVFNYIVKHKLYRT